MKDITKIKVLIGLVALLVLLNISLLGYMWFAPDSRPRGPRDGHGPGGLVIRELQFDDAQQRKFEQLRDEHHGAMISIGERQRHLHDELFKNLAHHAYPSIEVDSILAKISKGQNEKELITYHHLGLVREMCTAEQQKLFDAMIAKAMAQAHREEGPSPRD